MDQKVQLNTNFQSDYDRLCLIRSTLKSEFSGIDFIIDEVINDMMSWYLFPEMQERPCIINLWGLTGVGKTSLVERLVQLLSFEQNYFYFNLAEKGRIKGNLEDFNEVVQNKQLIIVLDEFQQARTIDENGSEVPESPNPIIWQLIDTGKFQVPGFTFVLEDIHHLIVHLRRLQKSGVKAKHGKVVQNKQVFSEWLEDGRPKRRRGKEDAEPASLLFVPENYYSDLLSISKTRFESEVELKEQLMQLDDDETIALLTELFHDRRKPQTIDCSKSLIFVIGNLDEAFQMSRDFNPDISADDFHKLSKKINITDIKHALKKRFRSEQIGRLGNKHRIYPALSEASFRQIIRTELERLGAKVHHSHGVRLTFEDSLIECIYKEGVYPVLGVRPLLDTIHSLVGSKLGEMLIDVAQLEVDVLSVELAYIQHLVVRFVSETKTIEKQYPLNLQLKDLRTSKRDDHQAIVAVHEAGHAVLSMALLHTIPQVVYSKTADRSEGFVHFDKNRSYIARVEMHKRVAVLLGGILAEELVFGRDFVSDGASSDIQMATSMVCSMVKEQGFSQHEKARMSVPNPKMISHVADYAHIYDAEVLMHIKQSELLAMKTLREYQNLLLTLADYLSDHSRLDFQTMCQMLQEYPALYSQCQKSVGPLAYRDVLKSKMHESRLTLGETTDLNELTGSIKLNNQ